ncbi:hypothetical protein L249_5737 [Ophiocordyceps polyrhachis-furcata BCC 54312]|uniref:Uncharacterized protein n=1 Tax=Ophiocordyceps polyrhachis-furcata BCC 54312 TaxID=1330021 RepID=A0A367KZS9_9HYPO|nr:hypothetical protein L249_5737 [Ophiocordyceps polyrhachis-furcata BCC 54312]
MAPQQSPSTISAVKTLVVPAVISLVIFLLLSFVLLPVWRRYRSRYGQYLPLNTLSERTSSLRHRIVGRLPSLGPLATFLGGRSVVFAPNSMAMDADLDDGEELDDVDDDMWFAMERHVPAAHTDSTRRLSRDLEEGFMDDSDEGPS